jgi:hypothetical protein
VAPQVSEGSVTQGELQLLSAILLALSKFGFGPQKHCLLDVKRHILMACGCTHVVNSMPPYAYPFEPQKFAQYCGVIATVDTLASDRMETEESL